MMKVFKEEINVYLKGIYENLNKQWEEMNKIVQDLKRK